MPNMELFDDGWWKKVVISNFTPRKVEKIKRGIMNRTLVHVDVDITYTKEFLFFFHTTKKETRQVCRELGLSYFFKDNGKWINGDQVNALERAWECKHSIDFTHMTQEDLDNINGKED